MMPRQDDFITLFNLLWYRDYPVVLGSIEFASRADWTTHIATTVRQVAGTMGIFACFETGGRTDAELAMADKTKWAKMEWEWEPVTHPSVGELTKLAYASSDCEVCIFVGYSHQDDEAKTLQKVRASWKGVSTPLLAFIVTYTGRTTRTFQRLQTYRCDSGGLNMLRDQPALPWCVENTRWEVMRHIAE